MLVYHGTTLSAWNSIQVDGITPRKDARPSNFLEIPSNPDTVYLSDTYAPYFAFGTANASGDSAVVIELDSSDLNPKLLVADEDALEQVSRLSNDKLPRSMGMVERTLYYRSMTSQYALLGLGFDWSMDRMGTGGYRGRISPCHFRRVAIIPPRGGRELPMQFLDCQVSVLNYMIMGRKYKAMTKAIFGEPYPDFGEMEAIYRPLPPVGGVAKILNFR